ncbi:MAG: RNA polymerase sigma factor [Planctomycetota bacterium]
MNIENLHKEYGKMLFGYLIAQTGDYTAAEDIFQETFLRIQRYGKSFEGTGSEKNYLFQIARNIYYDWLKQHKTEGQDMLDNIEVNSDPANSAENKDIRLTVAECVHKLPDKEREVLLLKEYENLKINQIANQLNIPEGTVKTRLRSALQTLKKRLQIAAVLEQV